MYNALPYQYQLLQAIQTTTYTQYIPQPLTLKPPEPKTNVTCYFVFWYKSCSDMIYVVYS